MWNYVGYGVMVASTWTTCLLTVALATAFIAGCRMDKEGRPTRHPFLVVLSFFNLLLMVACAAYWWTFPS